MSVEFSTDSKPEAAAIGSVRPTGGPDLTAECWFSTGRVIESLQLARAFSYLRGFAKADLSLASQSIPSWNRLVAWLKGVEILRQNAAWSG